MMTAGAMFLAFMIRFDWPLSPILAQACARFVIYAAITRIAASVLFGTYAGSFRYAGMTEAVQLVKAALTGTFVLAAFAFFTQSVYIGRSVLLIDYFFYVSFAGVFRFAPRAVLEIRQNMRDGLKRVLVIGASSAGEAVVRNMRSAEERIYFPVGFLDDDPKKRGRRIHGVRVLGSIDSLEDVAEKFNVRELIIALPPEDGREVRRVVSRCEKAGLKIKVVSRKGDFPDGGALRAVRDISVEDLLGRDAAKINVGDVFSLLNGRSVLVTGAGGTIGSELCRQIIDFTPRRLILFDIDENSTYFLELDLKKRAGQCEIITVIGDVGDQALLDHVFGRYGSDVVFHSAAHKHVPLMEQNPVSAVKNNILATEKIVQASERHGVQKFVLISTDKAVNPSSVMGATKRIAEMLVQERTRSARTKFMAVRFGNVMASSGSVIPIFKRQIEQGGPVTVTHPEIKRFFMTAPEAARLVLEAGAIGTGGEIFVLDMGEQIRIYDLAKNLITLAGLKPGKDIEIKFVGLRPGEKMQEEMLLPSEHDQATKSDRIYVAKPCGEVPPGLEKDLRELERLARDMDQEDLIARIRSIVPQCETS